MKRSDVLYGILAVIVAVVAVVCFTVPQETLNAYEYPPYLLLVVIPVGWLWIRAYIDAGKGN